MHKSAAGYRWPVHARTLSVLCASVAALGVSICQVSSCRHAAGHGGWLLSLQLRHGLSLECSACACSSLAGWK